MGLVTSIEHWEMPAASGMATEGIRAKYSEGAKVLAAVERITMSREDLE